MVPRLRSCEVPRRFYAGVDLAPREGSFGRDSEQGGVNTHRLLVALVAMGVLASAVAQNLPRSAYSGLEWRCIGPFRGGRTVGATGVPGKPSAFLVGVNNGGVWKTDD